MRRRGSRGCACRERSARTSVWTGFSDPGADAVAREPPGLRVLRSSRTRGDRGCATSATRQIVAGFERPIGAGFSLRVEAYRRTFDRLLVQRQETEAERQRRLRDYVIPPDLPPDAVVLEYRPTIFPENAGDGRAAGVEVLLRREGRRVSGWLGYTLSKSTRDLYGRTVPFDFDRRHAMNAVIDVTAHGEVQSRGDVQLASGFPATPVQEEVSFGQGDPSRRHARPALPHVPRPERKPRVAS